MRRKLLIPNSDQFRSLCRGAKDKFRGLFQTRSDFEFESRGEAYPGNRVFVIRRGSDCGLFSHLQTVLSGLKFALDRNWLPVVDLRTLKTIYHEPEEVGRVNVWEHYFEQPCGLSLQDVETAKDVVVTKDFGWPEYPSADMDLLADKNGLLSYWRDVVRRYVRLKPTVVAALRDAFAEVFGGSNDDVLGVFVRGTDYTRIRPVGHPVQPTIGQAVADARRMMAEFGLRRIFLVTEDRQVVEGFRAAFGSALVMKEQRLVDYDGGYIGECAIDRVRERERYCRGLDYLINVLLLSRCRHVLASRASGSVGAALFADGSCRMRFYDLGVYTYYGLRGGTEDGLA